MTNIGRIIKSSASELKERQRKRERERGERKVVAGDREFGVNNI